MAKAIVTQGWVSTRPSFLNIIIMKQYFCKYLPVEGEIKEGDKAIDENIHHSNNIVTITFDKYKTASDGRGIYSSEGLKKLKKVKLFLCSRDMQVGDKWQLMDGNGVIGSNIRKEGDSWSEIMQKNAYKVIGEISPNATWVKEGDEFDEYRTINLGITTIKNYISVKGPCGHFH